MKRLAQFIIIIAGFLLVFLLLPQAPSVAAGPMVVQGTNTAPDDLAAVQTAVDSADHQVILEGTFDFGDGTLTITRDITLRGRHDAVIRNGGVSVPENEFFRPTIEILPPANAVEIRDLKMEGSADIAIDARDDVTVDIRGNNITLASTGFAAISLVESSGSKVQNNTVSNAFWGILLESSDSAEVRNNDVESIERGIFLYDVSQSTVKNNSVSNTKFGISLELSDSVDVRNNDVEALNIGIWLFGASQSTIENNSVSIIGDTVDEYINDGLVGVYITPGLDFATEPPTFVAGSTANSISNTSLEGEMTYGFYVGEAAEDNNIFIAPRNLDGAIFMDQPSDKVHCDTVPPPNGNTAPPSGATVIFLDDEFELVPIPSKDNTVRNQARTFTFIDCGVDNVVK